MRTPSDRARYLRFEHFDVAAGLSHQKGNLLAMAREAHRTGRMLLQPYLRLSGHHNFGRPRGGSLGEYFDLASLRVDGESVRMIPAEAVADFESESGLAGRSGRRLRWDEAIRDSEAASVVTKDASGMRLLRRTYERIYPGFADSKATVEIHPEIRALADRLAAGVPPDAAWVHVRRGDLLRVTARWTTPEHIRATLRRFAPHVRTVYLATNEPDLRYFAPLAEDYDVLCLEDIDAFRDLARRDNYRLFLAEQALGERFPTRISTFRVEDGRFHGWLCDEPGFQ